MYVFTGKLNYLIYVVDEIVVLVLPHGFKVGDPVCVAWPWTKRINSATDKNEFGSTVISQVSLVEERSKIKFTINEYWQFIAVLESNASLISIEMITAYGNSSPSELSLNYSNPTDGCSVYSGILNYCRFAVDAMILVIVSGGLQLDEHICACWQWTETNNGQSKVNTQFIMTIDSVTISPPGRHIGFADRGGNFYRIDGVVNDENNTMTLKLSAHDEIRADNFIVYKQYPPSI